MMRTASLPGLIAAAVLLSLGGCFDNRVAGATSETTNGSITAVVTSFDGTPAAGVKVMLVHDSLWLSKVIDGNPVVLDSVVADAGGRFTLRLAAATRSNLQIDRGGEGFFLRGANAMAHVGPGGPTRQFRLAPSAAFSGRVAVDTGAPEDLRLAGTTYGASVGAGGGYAFTGIAEGAFPVVAQVSLSGAARPAMAELVVLKTGDSLVNKDFQVAVNRILIDDFDHGFDQTALGRLIGGGRWYATTDAPAGGNSTNEVDEISDTGAYAGVSVRARFILGKNLPHPYAMIGCYIGGALQGKTYDFTDARALSFWAKGKGSLNVRFTSEAVHRLFLDSAHFSYNQPLAPVWTRYTIPMDSLRVSPNAPPELKAWPWARAAREMTAIDFKASYPSSAAGDTVLLYLDEVYLEGVPLENFIR